MQEVAVLDFDSDCAHEFGMLQGALLQQGIVVPETDLMIAAVARLHNLTLVTHNTADFQRIPGLRLEAQPPFRLISPQLIESPGLLKQSP